MLYGMRHKAVVLGVCRRSPYHRRDAIPQHALVAIDALAQVSQYADKLLGVILYLFRPIVHKGEIDFYDAPDLAHPDSFD